MRKPAGVLVSAMVLAMIVAGGCKKDEAPSPTADPRGAARNMFSLLYGGTRAQFLSCFDGAESNLKTMGIIFDFNQTKMNFRGAFIKAYGKAAWDRFARGMGDPVSEKQMILDEIARSELKIDGNNATLINKNPGSTKQNPLQLAKFDDSWKILASSFWPSGEDGDKALVVLTNMMAVTAKYQKAIGKPGIKPEDVIYELAREANDMATGMTTKEPHRFDINKIK